MENVPSSNQIPAAQPLPAEPQIQPQPTNPVTPEIPVNPNAPSTQNKKLLIGLAVLVAALLGLGAWLYLRPGKTPQAEQNINPQQISNQQNAEVSEIPEELPQEETCQIAWVDPILPAEGEVEPLFLMETERVDGTGYEGIIRRTVGRDEDGAYIGVDLVTNILPNENAPYYLYALAIDGEGNVCSQSNLGPLEQIPDVGVWAAGPFYLPLENVNDGQMFAITDKGFGSSESDLIDSLYDQPIILIGAYFQNH